MLRIIKNNSLKLTGDNNFLHLLVILCEFKHVILLETTQHVVPAKHSKDAICCNVIIWCSNNNNNLITFSLARI